MRLINEKTGETVVLPVVRKDFRGEEVLIVGARPPHKPGSSGFCYPATGGEYYVGVFGLKWVEA